MLSLKNITKNYVSGDNVVEALKDISIEFRKSEFVSILGPSGCGKTTLLNIIGGLDRYTSGDLAINGVSTKEFREADWNNYRNHSIGFVFQSYNLIPHQTVLSNVELALTLSGVSKEERRKRAIDVLNKVGLGDQLKKKPNQMSGGQMQRVAIARALVNDPEILLADEPTGALDSETSVQVMNILKEISKDRLIIMVTHNPELAELYSSRIVRLLDGNIVGDTDPFDSAANDVNEERREAASFNDASSSKIDSASKKTDSDNTLSSFSPSVAKKPGKKKAKKRSMSFFTALSLSLNNLMTKKARTFLTSFAGSIGIIGIALILSLSTGINTYIEGIQEETLSSYPISITDETVDLSSLMLSMMQVSAESEEHEKDAIYSNPIFYELMNTINNEAIANDLKSFKAFLEKETDKELSTTELYKYVTAIVYSYNVTINAYATDPNGNYVKSDINALFASLMGNMAGSSDLASSFEGMSSMQSSTFQLWSQMLAPQSGEDSGSLVSDLITNEYDLLAGNWPTSSDEVVLILNRNNELSDLVLYSLGLKSLDEMTEIMMAVSRGEQIDTKVQKWQYDEIVGKTFKMILQSDYYQDTNNDGIYENISSNRDLLKTFIDKGKTLKISGIIRASEDSKFAILTGALGYTEELTKEIIDGIADSAVVKAQLENTSYDVITGLPFYLDSDIPDSEKITRFKEYCSELTDVQKRTLYGRMLTSLSDEEIAESVDAFLSRFQTPEERNSAIINMYAENLGIDPAVLEQYYGETLAALNDDEIRSMLTTLMQQSNDPETAISEILATPTQEELDAIIATNIQTTKDSYNSMIPEVMPKLDDRGASEMLIAAYYRQLTSMDENIIFEYLKGLTDEELRVILESMARIQYTSTPMTAEQENAKISALFDAYLASLSDSELADAYVNFTEISQSTYDTNIALLGITNFDTPSSVSIYTDSFENKDKIAEIISDYNDSVDENMKIVYTDYVALIMSSVTDIVNAISYVLIAFVSISLVVSSIMIGIITYISVLERTKEIGILRSIGASKKDISRVFNAETLIVGFAAGMIGIIVTVILCLPINAIIHLLTDIYEINATLPVLGAVILVIISMALTLIAGLIPSKIAAKKDPVVALRTE